MASDPYGLAASGLPPEMAADARRLTRQQAIAQALMQQSMQPVGGARQAGRLVVPPHWLEGAAKLAQTYAAKEQMNQSDRGFADLGKRYQAGLADEVKRIAAMRQGQTIMPDPQEIEQANDQGIAEPRPTTTGNPRAAIQAALLSQYEPVRQMGALEHKTFANEQTKAGDREARLHERVLALDAAAANQSIAREERAARAAEAAALRRELATMQDATRREIAAAGRASAEAARAAAEAARQQKNTPKLPPTALKMQQEELDAIGTSSSINADLAGIDKQITDGKLKLGLASNAQGAVRNFLGVSNENSRNLASFKSTLEKLRNDSLRLNKGVQTEGDAQRAWNELIANINDKGVVRQRLAEIQKINERAAGLRKMNLDVIRGNYGLEPLDTAGYTNQPAAIGTAAPAGVDPSVWAVMTPEEKALWKK